MRFTSEIKDNSVCKMIMRMFDYIMLLMLFNKVAGAVKLWRKASIVEGGVYPNPGKWGLTNLSDS